MSKFIGRLTKLGAGKESVRGTGVAPSFGIPWLDLSIDTKVTTERNEQAIGNIAIADDSQIMEQYSEITAKMKLKDISLGIMLLSTFGTVASVAKSAPDDTVYDHTFTMANTNTHQSLTMALKDPNSDERYPLCMVDSMKMEVEPGNYPTAEFSLKGKAAASASNTISILTTEKDFLTRHLALVYADDVAGLGAGTAFKMRKLSFEIKKNLLLDYANGSVEPDDVLNQGYEVTGSITLTHNANTFKTMQNTSLEKALQFTFTHPDTIGAAANRVLQFIFNKVKISNYALSRGPNDIVEESFDFEAFYKMSESQELKCILTNTQASY